MEPPPSFYYAVVLRAGKLDRALVAGGVHGILVPP